jgi:CheY-like chemotaxis protein
MSRQGRVLVVDDEQDWCDEIVEALKGGGFDADSAVTVERAFELLNEKFFHVLVLDIRMDENNPEDSSGIDILKELDERGLIEAIRIIMLSAYDTKEQVRTAFKTYKVTDFLSKDNFRTQELLKIIRQVFADEVNINLELAIHWQQVIEPKQIVLNIFVNGTRIKRNTPLQDRIADEVDDLFCRLFYKAESILVRPLGVGQSGTGVLWVQPFYTAGGGRAVVVKFGDFHKIDDEYRNFKQFVQPFIGGGRNTTVLDLRRTPHLGGIVYSLLGATNVSLEDFGEFYKHAEISQIKLALDSLFLDTCSVWYANPGQLKPYNLSEDYQKLLGFTPENLEHALNQLQENVNGRPRLRFRSLPDGRTFTNPLLIVKDPPFVLSTYVCTTHGDFNQHNILVDSTNQTWLIDFQRTGQGHIMRDIAELDSEIRFVLLAPNEANLEERFAMEEALCRVERYSQLQELESRFRTENIAVRKALATVVQLRTLARRLVTQNPSDDMREYSIALLYIALNTIRFIGLPSGLPSLQREHALLCASLLVDQLRLRG